MKQVAAPVLLLLLAPLEACLAAQPVPQDESLAWLVKMSVAAQQLNYTGTFIYQQGGRNETSRIAHLVEAGREYEKIESLDGLPRETIRSNDQVTCYYPESKTVRVEKRPARSFPAVFPEQLSGIAEYYEVKKEGMDRVAGFACQVTVLKPKDSLRYSHSFCAEVKTGLPLRAQTVNERGDVVERFAFTQLSLGGNIGKDKVRPRFSLKDPGWRLDQSPPHETLATDTGWEVKDSPAGFRKIMEAKRMIQGKAAAHIVYSDGLAAVSVFVEPAQTSGRSEAHSGAINIYTRPYQEHTVTILGEAPASTVRKMGDSVTYRGK